MQLLLDYNNVIVEIAKEIVAVDEGYKVGNTIYPYSLELQLIEIDTVPDYVRPQKYMYVNGEFKLNPNYVEPIVAVSVEEMQQLKQELAVIKQALDDLILGGVQS